MGVRALVAGAMLCAAPAILFAQGLPSDSATSPAVLPATAEPAPTSSTRQNSDAPAADVAGPKPAAADAEQPDAQPEHAEAPEVASTEVPNPIQSAGPATGTVGPQSPEEGSAQPAVMEVEAARSAVAADGSPAPEPDATTNRATPVGGGNGGDTSAAEEAERDSGAAEPESEAGVPMENVPAPPRTVRIRPIRPPGATGPLPYQGVEDGPQPQPPRKGTLSGLIENFLASPELPTRRDESGASQEEQATADDALFPTAPIIEGQKAFWIKVFAEVHSDEGYIHDGSLTIPIYERINLEGRSRREQRRFIKRRKHAIASELRALASAVKNGEPFGARERELLELVGPAVTPKRLRELADEVRFQRGLADRFEEGLVRSGAVLAEMRGILAEQGVPPDLAYLPHVESSFNIRGYSKFGAAGIWQFTRGTGRKFLTVRYEVDERLDPILATHAAAKFLRQNHDRLGSWPLAITAYNHGPQGVERIVAKQGTRDLGTLIETCDCYRFKFASKNFYAEFLAAREIARNYRRYFGAVNLEPPLRYQEVELPFYLAFSRAAELLGIAEEPFSELNPSLRSAVVVGTKHIPKGYALRLPGSTNPAAFLAAVPESDRYRTQKRTETIAVRRGDTLFDIGRRYNVPWQIIARANHITAYRRIRPGQRLVIPRLDAAKSTWLAKGVPLPDAKDLRAMAMRPPEPSAKDAAARKAALSTSDRAIALQRAEGTMLSQNLEVVRLSRGGSRGHIEAAYGETLGHYAEWAQVPTHLIRRANGAWASSALQPGRLVTIPFSEVGPVEFSQARSEYHRGREEDFYSSFATTEVLRVKARRGDSVWNMAQESNIPMWLLFQQNPDLITRGLRIGDTVNLPIIEALQDLEEQAPPAGAPPVFK